MSDPRCNFTIGQKVIFAPEMALLAFEQYRAAQHRASGWTLTLPEFNGVYRIRAVMWDNVAQRTGVYLMEIINPPIPYADGLKEPGFWHVMFKPAADISDLKKLLTTKPVLEDA